MTIDLAWAETMRLQIESDRLGLRVDDVGWWLEKAKEELAELEEEVTNGAVITEYGDVLFVLAVIADVLGVDPAEQLAETNTRFMERLGYVESKASPQDTREAKLAHFAVAKRQQQRKNDG